MNGVPCYFLVPTSRVRQYLRRYHSGSQPGDAACPVHGMGYHNAWTPIGEAPAHYQDGYLSQATPTPPESDPRWPTTCACGYVFQARDPWQLFESLLYQRQDTGEEMTLREAGPGAMWNADWLIRGLDYSSPQAATQPWPWKPGPDGLCLTVRLPDGHDWIIDSRSSNCTMPQDNVHSCWVRHGTPPNISVGKSGGLTCSAGGGSIMSPSGWHGFLTNGILHE